jgi:5-(carboxyamino)imidazole ribonucleotide mutase
MRLARIRPVPRKTSTPSPASSSDLLQGRNESSPEPSAESIAGGSAPFAADVRIGIAMGSANDWETMRVAAETLKEFGIAFDARVVSAHRMPDAMYAYAEAATVASANGALVALIAGAGGAAHLPGMLAAKTIVPVLGVPIPSRHLHGQDSLYSIVQMPRGIPVATFAIGSAGAANAALFAVAMLASNDKALATRLQAWRDAQTRAASETKLDL